MNWVTCSTHVPLGDAGLASLHCHCLSADTTEGRVQGSILVRVVHEVGLLAGHEATGQLDHMASLRKVHRIRMKLRQLQASLTRGTLHSYVSSPLICMRGS